MTISGKRESVSFYACGTPTNDRGFEYTELGPMPLPGQPSDYLDQGVTNRVGRSHGFRRLDVGSKSYVVYTQSIPTQPNDSTTNRGAYIAAGFLIGIDEIRLNVLENGVASTFEIIGALHSRMDEQHRLPPSFRLKEFRYRPLDADRTSHHCPPSLLCDIICQASRGLGPFARNQSLRIATQQFRHENSAAEFSQFAKILNGSAFLVDEHVLRTLLESHHHVAVAASGMAGQTIETHRLGAPRTRGPLPPVTQTLPLKTGKTPWKGIRRQALTWTAGRTSLRRPIIIGIGIVIVVIIGILTAYFYSADLGSVRPSQEIEQQPSGGIGQGEAVGEGSDVIQKRAQLDESDNP